MKYKCVNNIFYNKRTKIGSDYSEYFTIGKLYDIWPDTDSIFKGFWLIKTNGDIERSLTDELLNSMFISLIDLRNEKLKSIL